MNTRLQWLWALAPAALLAFGTPALAGTVDADQQQKDLAQARKELDQARDELKRAAQEMARVTREMDHDSPRGHAFEFLANPDHAVLGVSISPGPDKDGVLRGVLVTAVTPGSGADKAGLKSGDLLTSVNGKSLSAKSGERPGPERRLLDVMSGLKAGDEVRLEYERDGRNAVASATAGRAQDIYGGHSPMLSVMPDLANIGPMLDFDNDDEHDIILPPALGSPHIRIQGRDAWELAALDADLAPYFKTTTGVLVLKPPKDSKLGLKSGDVVQKVNGDAVKEPAELRHRLHELAGKEVALDIVRKGKSESVKGKLPESRHALLKKRIELHSDDDDPS